MTKDKQEKSETECDELPAMGCVGDGLVNCGRSESRLLHTFGTIEIGSGVVGCNATNQ